MEKYYLEFKDILNLYWKAYFSVEDFAGISQEMEPTENPISFDFLSPIDDIHQNPIKGSVVNFFIFSDTNFKYAEIFDAAERDIQVKIYSGSGLYWSGYVIPAEYSENYDGDSYQVKISAADGLGLLSDIAFLNNDVPYTGRQSAAFVIYEILSKIGYTQFSEFINIYEETMDDAVSDSPLDQMFLDMDLFLDFTCYECLTEILKIFNASIRQKSGEFVIYKPTDLNQEIVYGRIFTSASVKSATSMDPACFISRVGSLTDIQNIEGGIMGSKRASNKIIIHQDLGERESWLHNWELKRDSYDDDLATFKDWQPSAGWAKVALNGISDGVVMQPTSSEPPAGIHIDSTFGDFILSSETDMIKFEFDYFVRSFLTLPLLVRVYIKVKADNASKYLYVYDDLECRWKDTEDFVKIDITATPGDMNWQTFSRIITGIPTAGSHTIQVFGLYNVSGYSVYGCFKNFRFNNTSDKINVIRNVIPKKFTIVIFTWTWDKITRSNVLEKGESITEKLYTATNDIYGELKELSCIIGDVQNVDIENIVEQFKGSLAVYSGADLIAASNWNSRTPGGEDSLLLDMLKDELKLQYSKARKLLSIPIIEKGDDSIAPQVDLIGSYQDPLNKFEGSNRVFVINRASFDVRNREWNIDFIEILPIP